MWIFPKNMFRRAKDAAWSRERSPLLLAFRMISASAQQSARGVPDGMEDVIAKAAERGRWTWLASLGVVLVVWVGIGLTTGLPPLAHIVILALFALCVVEATKYAFVVWHCRTKGSAREFLSALLGEPALLIRDRAPGNATQ